MMQKNLLSVKKTPAGERKEILFAGRASKLKRFPEKCLGTCFLFSLFFSVLPIHHQQMSS